MNKLKFTCLEFNIITNILSKFVFHGMRQHIKNILKKKRTISVTFYWENCFILMLVLTVLSHLMDLQLLLESDLCLARTLGQLTKCVCVRPPLQFWIVFLYCGLKVFLASFLWPCSAKLKKLWDNSIWGFRSFDSLFGLLVNAINLVSFYAPRDLLQ